MDSYLLLVLDSICLERFSPLQQSFLLVRRIHCGSWSDPLVLSFLGICSLFYFVFSFRCLFVHSIQTSVLSFSLPLPLPLGFFPVSPIYCSPTGYSCAIALCVRVLEQILSSTCYPYSWASHGNRGQGTLLPFFYFLLRSCLFLQWMPFRNIEYAVLYVSFFSFVVWADGNQIHLQLQSVSQRVLGVLHRDSSAPPSSASSSSSPSSRPKSE